MLTNVFFSVYLCVLIIGSIAGFRNWSTLSVACRWICGLLLITFISESTAEYFRVTIRNNLFVYHFYNPVEIFMISMYFNESIPAFKKRNAGLWIGIFGAAASVGNTLFLQQLNAVNSNHLLFECFAIIAMSVFAFYRMYKNEDELIRNPHFWITSLLMFYYSITFFHWGMDAFFATVLRPYHISFLYVLWTANLLSYAGIAVVFMLIPKMAYTR